LVVLAAVYKTKNKFADELVLWQSKGDTYRGHICLDKRRCKMRLLVQ
jgi:hypothetical protein